MMETIVFWIAKAIIAIMDLFSPRGISLTIFERDFYDYARIVINAPTITVRYEPEEDNTLILLCSFGTQLRFEKTDIFLILGFKVLGFGLCFIKQKGY